MVPSHRGISLQLVTVVVVQVGTQHLTGIQSATVPPASIVLLIVQITHQHKARLVGETAPHTARSIAMVGAARQVDVGHISAIHALLDGEVEHSLLVAVLDACNTGLVALLVIELHILNDAHRQILQSRLHIAQHELLAVEQNLFNLLAVDGDVAVFVDFCSRHSLDEFFDGRTFRCSIGVGVINQRVFPDNNLCRPTRHHGFLQHDSLWRH